MSEVQFEKHVYGCDGKKNLELLEDFDPCPLDCKGQATTNLDTFMQKVKGRNLGVSLLLNRSAQRKQQKHQQLFQQNSYTKVWQHLKIPRSYQQLS